MKMFFAVVFAVAFSGLAMAAGNGNGDGGDGGSVLAEKMIANNEAAIARWHAEHD